MSGVLGTLLDAPVGLLERDLLDERDLYREAVPSPDVFFDELLVFLDRSPSDFEGDVSGRTAVQFPAAVIDVEGVGATAPPARGRRFSRRWRRKARTAGRAAHRSRRASSFPSRS